MGHRAAGVMSGRNLVPRFGAAGRRLHGPTSTAKGGSAGHHAIARAACELPRYDHQTKSLELAGYLETGPVLAGLDSEPL